MRWCFGDQLGPHFTDDTAERILLVECRSVLRRRRFHRQKAHLILSAIRHRAAELGDRAVFVQADTYREALAQVPAGVSVRQPTSQTADRFVRRLGCAVLPARGFAIEADEFARWRAAHRARPVLDSFYRFARRHLGLLMDGDQPAGGRWSYDAENRCPPPRKASTLGVPEPLRPVEDDIDAGVRRDLDRWARAGDVSFVGRDGPRWTAATRAEALGMLDHFVGHRLATFGPYQDAMLAGDQWMSHSQLSAPLNLGLLGPYEVAERAERAYRAGRVPLASAEGFIRQVVGWREYVWHMYWTLGRGYRLSNALHADRPLPRWMWELDPGAVAARCLSTVLAEVRDRGYTHHIGRLMVLGNHALQRGYRPADVTAWFHQSFVDGYDWVMVPNVIGMALHADGGLLVTKPYAAGGAYVNRMSDFCAGCRYRPAQRLGVDACPYTAGYWAFLARQGDRLAANVRMRPALRGLARLPEADAIVAQERRRRRF